AGAICLFACFTALSVLARAATTQGRQRRLWLAVTAAVAGSGGGGPPFVALLAVPPNLPVGYGNAPPILSVVGRLVVAGGGFAVGLADGGRRRNQLIGGAIVGFGVFAMHYTGMAALRVPAVVSYDPLFVVASLALGMGLSAPATRLALRTDGLLAQV